MPERNNGALPREIRRFKHHLGLKIHRDIRLGNPRDNGHDIAHGERVGNRVLSIANPCGLNEREVELTQGALVFGHDYVRSPRQDIGGSDERRSAEETEIILVQMNNRGIYLTTAQEREAIAYAIERHEETPYWLKNPLTRNKVPEEQKNRLWLALWFADGLDKTGEWAVIKRTFYCAARLTRGDLKEARYVGSNEKIMNSSGKPDIIDAILIQSALQRGWSNLESMYSMISSIAKPAFEVEKRWILGLLAAKELTLSGWAEMSYNTVNNKGENIFQFSRANPYPVSIEEVIKTLVENSGIKDEEVQEAAYDRDRVNSAVEIALYLSQNQDKPLGQVLRVWQPKGEEAKKMKEFFILGFPLKS